METRVGAVPVRFDERQVLRIIRDLRAEHHACTGRAVAGRFGNSPASMNSMLAQLQLVGYVDMTPMPGSLHLTAAGIELLERDETPAPTQADGQGTGVSTVPATGGRPAQPPRQASAPSKAKGATKKAAKRPTEKAGS